MQLIKQEQLQLKVLLLPKGDIELSGGNQNTAIFASGSTKPTGATYTVEVEDVKSTGTVNSTAIYAAAGATVNLTGGTSGSTTDQG